MALIDFEKSFALDLVKKSISYYFETNKYLSESSVDLDPLPADSDLFKNCGLFVTLTSDESLRGCIGTITAVIPLYQGLIRNAVSAAFYDPRFPSLTRDEFEGLHYEISVIGVVKPLPSIDQLKIGNHGLIIRQGGYQGLLLPQVAVDWDWTPEQFLEQTCQKAGLPIDAYKEEDTEILYFTAEVFS